MIGAASSRLSWGDSLYTLTPTLRSRCPVPPIKAIATLLLAAAPLLAQPAVKKNSIGIPIQPIPAGTFTMGSGSEPLPKNIIDGVGVMSQPVCPHGDFDETPAHPVEITKPFAIATTHVTAEQYRQFDPTYKPNPARTPPTSPASPGRRPWPSARGSPRKKASPTACPPKPNGSTSPALARRASTPPAPSLSNPASPTAGESPTWRLAALSGRSTGTRPTTQSPKPIPPAPNMA